MAISKSTTDNEKFKFGGDNDTFGSGTRASMVINGGIVTSGNKTYANGDAAYLNMDTAGRVKCILDGATFIFSGGDLEVDVSAFRTTGSVRADALVFTNKEDLGSPTAEYWQGMGGFDQTGDRFVALPINTDNAAMPADANFLPLGGEYNATTAVYADGDAAILQTDINGRVRVTGDGVYVATRNPAPHNAGVVGHVAAATPAATNQTVRVTAGQSAGASTLVGANFHGLDTRSKLYAYSDSATAEAPLSALDYSKADDASQKLSVASEIVNFATTGSDFTGAIGILGASNSGAVPMLLDASGKSYVIVESDPTNTDEASLKWTTHNIADGIDPDTGSEIDVRGAKTIYIQYDTTSGTAAANFDFHTLSSTDNTTWTTTDYTGVTAQAINVVDSQVANAGAAYLKAQLDVNAVNMSGTDAVDCKIFVTR